MEATLIIGKNVNLKNYSFQNQYVIGVDEGAWLSYQNGISLNLAIGDFDSVSEKHYEILEKTVPCIRLKPEKDVTDTEAALAYCRNMDKITILGGIQGQRIEHLFAILKLMRKDPRIILIDDNSKIMIRSSSFHLKKEDYEYVSFFAIKNVSFLTLKGFYYPLRDYFLSETDDIAVSNRFVKEEGQVIFQKGELLVVLTRKETFQSQSVLKNELS